jgi:hypothetical protein
MISRRAIGPALLGVSLAGCGTAVTVATFLAAIKATCGVIVMAEQLAEALGTDLTKWDVALFAQSICDKFQQAEMNAQPRVPPPPELQSAAPQKCYTLIVNGKPVTACK